MLTRPATRRPDRGGVTAVFASCAQGQEGARAGPAQPLLGRRAPRLVQAGANQGGAACLTRPHSRPKGCDGAGSARRLAAASCVMKDTELEKL